MSKLPSTVGYAGSVVISPPEKKGCPRGSSGDWHIRRTTAHMFCLHRMEKKVQRILILRQRGDGSDGAASMIHAPIDLHQCQRHLTMTKKEVMRRLFLTQTIL